MMPAVWVGGFAFSFTTVSVVTNSGSGGVDIVTILASYGIAAPFAILCWWQMVRSQAKVDKLETDIRGLQDAAVNREKEFAQRLAPLLYDGAMLYRKGNEQLTKNLEQVPTDEVGRLVESVQQLIVQLETK